MNLLDTILNNNAVVNQVAQQLDLDPGAAQNAMQHMVPALSKGLTNNMKKEGGLESLIGALSGGSHEKYIENPDTLAQESTIQDGNAILGHVLGSKDVSRNVAGHAAEKTGVDPALLKKMLPLLATVVMGALSKQTKQTGVLEQSRGGGLLGNLLGGLGGKQSGGGAANVLGSFLDADKDGSAVDDILGLARKFF